MTHTVILHDYLQTAAYECKSAKVKAQAAVNKLSSLADYPMPSTLAEITAKHLTDFVAQRINAVKATSLYTQAEKDRIVSDWTEWEVKAMPNVAAIEKFLNDYPEVSPDLDAATMTITTNDIIRSLAPRFTKDVPEEAHRHIALIESVRQAINSLRTWEKAQDIKKIPLHELLRFEEDNLCQLWSAGTIKVNHNAETEKQKLWREAYSAATL